MSKEGIHMLKAGRTNGGARRLRSSRTTLRAVTALAGVLALAACGSTPPAEDASADSGRESTETISMKVGAYPGLFVSLPLWVAADQGMFEDHHLDVELITVTSGPNMISAAASNSIDVMQNGATITAVTNSKGQDFRLIAPTVPQSIYNMFGTNEVLEGCEFADKPYPEPLKCAEGKRIGVVALASESYVVALSVLGEVGLTEKDVTFVPAGAGPAIVQSMQADQIDFAFAEDTATAFAVDSLKIAQPVVDLKENGTFSEWIGNGLFALQANLDADPEKFSRFAAAIDEANAWIEDPANRDAATAIYKKNSPTLDDTTAAAIMDLVPGYFGSEVSCQSIENIAEWLEATGQVEAGSLSDDCSDLVWDETVKLS